MIGEAVNATFRKFFAARLACMLVAITSILEFLPSNKELEDERVGFATHLGTAWQKMTGRSKAEGASARAIHGLKVLKLQSEWRLYRVYESIALRDSAPTSLESGIPVTHTRKRCEMAKKETR